MTNDENRELWIYTRQITQQQQNSFLFFNQKTNFYFSLSLVVNSLFIQILYEFKSTHFFIYTICFIYFNCYQEKQDSTIDVVFDWLLGK